MGEIVRLQSEHIPIVARIETESFSLPWSEKAIRSLYENECGGGFVFLKGAEIAGYCGFYIAGGEGEIATLAVKQDFRRRGIGEKLLHAILNELKMKKCTAVFLEVRESNAAAVALYEKAGFTQFGKRRKYYQNPTENALLYRLELHAEKP